MRDQMNRLAAVIGRRRRWVVGIWIAIVVCALPFAARQTEHLSGGGFDVPGSQSKAVSDEMEQSFADRAGGYQIAVFTSPTPFRAGPVDFSVLVQDAASEECVPEAQVTVCLKATGAGRTLECRASRSMSGTSRHRQKSSVKAPGSSALLATCASGPGRASRRDARR